MDKVRGAYVFNIAVIAEVVIVVETTIASFVGNSATVETRDGKSTANVDVAQPLCVEEANAMVAHVPVG